MRTFKKILAAGVLVLTIGFIIPSFTQAAAKVKRPVEITADLTNRTIESILKEIWETGKSPVQIANEAGKLDEFKKESVKQEKQIINQRVKDGVMTQAQADAIIKSIDASLNNEYPYGYYDYGYYDYGQGYYYGGGHCGGHHYYY